MASIFILVRKDIALFFRNRAALLLTFLVPFALIWIFGEVFGVNREGGGPAGIPLAVVNASADPGADRLVAALQAEESFKVITQYTEEDESVRLLREDDIPDLMRANKFRFAVVIPEDLFDGKNVGLHLRTYTNPRNEIETQTVHGLLQKTIFTAAPQLIGQSLIASGRKRIGIDRIADFNKSIADHIAAWSGDDPEQVLKRIDAGEISGGFLGENDGNFSGDSSLISQLIQMEAIQVMGSEVKSPAATRIVGGWAIQFLLFSVTASATALFLERDQGIFYRILAGPVSRAQILWSKFVFGVLIGMIQLVVLFLAGRILYGIDVENHIGFLLLVCAFAAASCTAFGMLLAAVSPSREAAMGLATFLILLMCAVGGAWFPVTLMPEFMQQASRFTLIYWAMEAFSQVLWADASFVELLPSLGILGGMIVVVMSIAVWRFNRGNLFQ